MNLFELFVKIGVDSEGVKRGIDDTKNALDKLSSFAVAKGQVIANSLTAAAKAAKDFAVSSVNAFGQYEQLEGGVKTLFGDETAKKLTAYADQAYKTAGMSKNAYLQNITDFSAALINSLDGDTEKAADAANKAMVAISDNANKMGTSIDAIVGTYQSLARGNYQMLDNLKLGYGGTKTELERLLKDAEEYQKTLGVTADYSADSFSDIVEAIDVVQQKMGIAGATQAEAATTVEGSLNTLNASWDNLVVSFGQGGEAMDAAMDQFFESFETAADQVLPVVGRVLTGIAEMLPTFVSKLIEMLPGLVSTLIPAILDAAISLVFAIIESLPEFAQMIIENIPVIIQKIIEAIPRLVVELLAAVFNIGVELVKGFWDGIVSMATWLWDQITGFFGGIIDGIKGLFGIHSPSKVFKEEIGKNLALGIGEGFSEEMEKVNKDIEDVISGIETDTDLGDISLGLGGIHADQDSPGIQAITASIATEERSIVSAIDDFKTLAITFLDGKIVDYSATIYSAADYLGQYIGIVADLVNQLVNDPLTDTERSIAKIFGEGFEEDLESIAGELRGGIESVKAPTFSAAQSSYGDISVTVNVGGSNSSAEDIAESVARELQILLDRRNAAYGYA